MGGVGAGTIRLARLSKEFLGERERVLAMDDLTLEVESRSFFTLLGPSGCGKSTLLRCVAGLETPDRGEIEIGGKLVFSSARGVNVQPNKRNIGMVFQSYAIWPHMTVFENVAFPLEVRRRTDVRERALAALSLVKLENLAERYASRLSGGQQQRVAFARAIVGEPDLLLLDEPLSNLDAALRKEMCMELRKLQERLKVTTLYVTHDQAEALSMSDRIAVMRAGRFVEIASPEDLYERPQTVFTAEFIGGANILEGKVAGATDAEKGTAVATAFGTVRSGDAARSRDRVTLFVRPEHIRPLRGDERPPAGANVFACTVKHQHFVGDSRELELSVAAEGDERTLRCKSPADFRVNAGDQVVVVIDPADVYILKGD